MSNTADHNPDAMDVLDCEACLEMVTNPELGRGIMVEIRTFSAADRAHFDSLRDHFNDLGGLPSRP